jgi:hypothetical protein
MVDGVVWCVTAEARRYVYWGGGYPLGGSRQGHKRPRKVLGGGSNRG